MNGDIEKVKTIGFHRSYFEAAQLLPTDEQRHRFYDALLVFAFCGVEPDFSEDLMLQLAWSLCRPNLLASVENAINGAKGGRPRKDQGVNPA